jgi:hypothetical protein
MSTEHRLTAIQHGAIVMLIGLFFGFATMLEEEPIRFWHTAHETTVFIGIMLLAVASALPHLKLERREARALMRSIFATGYGLPAGLLIQALIGEHAFSPTTDPIRMFGFLCNITGMGGSVFLASLTVMGARAARSAVASDKWRVASDSSS